MSLENAPDQVKLAVDLIVLLEENQLTSTNGATRAVWRSSCVIMKTNLKLRKAPRKLINCPLVCHWLRCQSRRNITTITDRSWNDSPPHPTTRSFGKC